MENIWNAKVSKVDELSGRFLKDGPGNSLKPISPLFNLAISHGVFLSASKVPKLNLMFKVTFPTRGLFLFSQQLSRSLQG